MLWILLLHLDGNFSSSHHSLRNRVEARQTRGLHLTLHHDVLQGGVRTAMPRDRLLPPTRAQVERQTRVTSRLFLPARFPPTRLSTNRLAETNELNKVKQAALQYLHLRERRPRNKILEIHHLP